jgi:dipeptidase E
MNKLFISSSFSDVAKHFPAFAKEDCAGKTVTFIPTASTVEKVNFFVKSAKKAFAKLGITVDELDVSTASREEMENKLRTNDYIYVSGGNTFFLLQELKRTGADQLILEQIDNGKTYIGESAGSIILAKQIEFACLMDDRSKAESLQTDEALGVVDFTPVPHHTNFPFAKAVEKILAKYGTTLDLRPMSNKQVITVWGEQVELVGELNKKEA